MSEGGFDGRVDLVSEAQGIRNKTQDLKKFLARIKGQNDKPHQVFSLTVGATKEEIKRTYKKLALLYHPDKNKDHVELCVEITQIVNAAADVLLCEEFIAASDNLDDEAGGSRAWRSRRFSASSCEEWRQDVSESDVSEDPETVSDEDESDTLSESELDMATAGYNRADAAKVTAEPEDEGYEMVAEDGTKFSCKNCRRSFTSKFSVKRHTNTRVCYRRDLKPAADFICQECLKTFTTKQSLKIHDSVCFRRRNRLPFICSKCNYEFTRKYNLDRHFLRCYK